MAYCRWSSDSFRCDLYIYHHIRGGLAIHVAASRHVLPDEVRSPDLRELTANDSKEHQADWRRRYEAFHEALDAAPIEPIGLPHAGATFMADSGEEAVAKIAELRELGYRAPDWLESEILKEYRP